MRDENQDLPDISDGGEAEAEMAPHEAASLSSGTVLGDFEIIEKVGCGGMGVVYKAFERSLRRVVALKVLNPVISENPSLAKRFRREAILAANLSHPNIVPVYQVDQADRPRYFTMEYVQGESLKDRVERDGPMHPAEAVRITTQACEALHHAHEHNIIHRDIKPGNILLQNHVQRVRITDFGIAQDVTGKLAERTETTGFTAGTPAFMSPEQNLGLDLDCRTDVFSLGMTLYYMLTGELAYHAANRAELALAFREQSPEPPSHHNPQVSPVLDKVVLKTVATDREGRYPDCLEVAEALQTTIESRKVAATVPGKQRQPRVRPIRAVVVSILGSVAVSAAVLVWLLLWGPELWQENTSQRINEQEPTGSEAGTSDVPPPPVPPGPYLREHPATFDWIDLDGGFVSDKSRIFVKDWPNGGTVLAEKRLDRPVYPDEDFSLLLDLETDQDTAGHAGWFKISLLNEEDEDEMVAAVEWRDDHPGAGYGGLAFFAERHTPLYRSEPPDMPREYPRLDGLLKLSRTGSRWTAYLGGDPKGEMLTLSSARIATRVRLEAGCFQGVPPRQIEIRGIYVLDHTRDAPEEP